MLTKLYVKGQMLLDDLRKDQRGVTAIEYAIVGVSVAALVALVFKADGSGALSTSLGDAMTKIASYIPK